MGKGNARRDWLFLGVAAVAAVLLVVPGPVRAVDTDNDGFSDAEEAAGITLTDSATSSTRTVPMNPAVKDLFVILVTKNPTLMPANPLEFLSGGLGIATHEMAQTEALDADRGVTATQKALRITEAQDPTGNILGISNYGTPNGLDLATIYTARIRNFIDTVCAGLTDANCVDGVSGLKRSNGLYDRYAKDTIAHEAGHMLSLAAAYNDRFGGYHYKSGDRVVMEQSVYYTNKGGKVTFYIPNVYTAADTAGIRLK